jgi:beta-glucanase (GH16 family)
MSSRINLILFLILGLMAAPVCAQNWQLVWQDEFEGESLDMEKWSYQTGTGSEYGLTDWGNNELQYYREENVTLSDGMLHVTAKRESYRGKSYTSGRIRTVDKGDWTYCRIEFRAKMPLGKGLWAAVWMLPTDEEYGGWAASGELDIM